MTRRENQVRAARRDDATLLAELLNFAGEGLPLYVWSMLAGADESPWGLGRERALRETGSISFRNATIIEEEGRAVIGYEIPEDPEPVSPDILAMFVPLQELENLASGTWYVYVLAVLPEFRNRGLGSQLLSLAEETERKLGKRGMSLIVSNANLGARRLYERLGYGEIAWRTVVKENWNWNSEGQERVLLTKAL